MALIGAFGAMPGAALATDTLMVSLDQAEIEHLPERVATVVVGNPAIADVSIQAGGIMVLTGKGYGSTNVVALDRAGHVLMEKRVQIEPPQEHLLVLYRGVDRETYTCNPGCQPRLVPGDSKTAFEAQVAQTAARLGLAQLSAAPPTAGVGPGGQAGASAPAGAPMMSSSSSSAPASAWTPGPAGLLPGSSQPITISIGR